jgi:outer membrane protein OmpA-like peptidoglycan-associated protein
MSNRSPKAGERALAFCFDNLYTPVAKTFPYTKTLCTLKTGNEYTLRLWINTGNQAFSHLDVLLTPGDPSRTNNTNSNFEPTFQFDNSNIVQKENSGWLLLSKQFTPREDYNFLLFGNFLNNAEYAKLKNNKTESSGNIMYQVDEIELKATDSSLNNCPRYEETLRQLYAETRRHTKYVYLDEKRALAVREKPHAPVLRSDTLVIPGVLFQTNSSSIDTGYQALLNAIIIKIKDKDLRAITINGHTDNSGTVDYNKTLSLKRAAAVGAYLIDHLPKLKAITTENGYGDTCPVASNNNEANKAKNRRVEIIVGYLGE